MSLTVTQAVAIAGYFQNTIGDGVEPEQKIIKRLTKEQRNICYQAFEIVSRATQKDLNVPEQDSLDKNVVTEIKTSLNEPLVGEEPADHAWYAKPFYFIAHKISSLVKGFANIFWRVGSGALSEKAIAYRDDVVNYQKELNSYWYETETDAGNKIPLYEDVKTKIKNAGNNYHEQDEAVAALERFYGIFEKINGLAHLENVKKIRAERGNLSNEACSYLGYNNLKIKALSDIVLKVIETDISLEAIKRPDANLEKRIFGPLWELATKIKTDNKNEKKLKLKKIDIEYASFLEEKQTFNDQINETRKPVEELEKQKETELNGLRNKMFKELGAYWGKRQVKSGTDEEQEENFRTEYHNEISQMREREQSERSEICEKFNEIIERKQEEIEPALEKIEKAYRDRPGREHEKYDQAREKVKNEIKGEKGAKAKAENELIAEEIRIAIKTLDAEYSPMIDEQVTLFQTTKQYQVLVEEKTTMEANEELLKIKYPQLKPIGDDVTKRWWL